jgi:hypothetical protein
LAYTNTTETRFVAGDKRIVMSLGTVNIAGADTFDTGLRIIQGVSVNSAGVNAIGCTVAGGIVTFTGATGAVSLIAIGE